MATPLQALRSARTRRAIETRLKLEELKKEPTRLKLAFEQLKGVMLRMPELGTLDSFDIDCSGGGFVYLTIRLRFLTDERDNRLLNVLWAFRNHEPWVETPTGLENQYTFLGRFSTGHRDTLGLEMFHRPILVTIDTHFAQHPDKAIVTDELPAPPAVVELEI